MANILILYMVAINAIAILIYGFDKVRAINNKWRIPEKDLWLLAIIGGAYGATLGMILFHHKIRKDHFVGGNVILCLVWGIILYRLKVGF